MPASPSPSATPPPLPPPLTILVDDVRSFRDARPARVARSSQDALRLLKELGDTRIDHLWLDHDLVGDDTIRPVVQHAIWTSDGRCTFPLSPDETALVEHARSIAEAAHKGQEDKAHLPYFESHVADVHRRVVSYGGGVNEQIAALLHDVLEDTKVSEVDLRSKGFPEAALAIVKLLTKVPGEPQADYYERISRHEPSRRVKLLGDIASNSDPERLALLPEETRIRLTRKYAEATRHLRRSADHN